MPTLNTILGNPWRLEPSVAIGVLLLTALYVAALTRRAALGAAGPINRGQVACVLAAMATILVTLAPVVDRLADGYSLTVHMLQHMALSFVMPPLLLLGVPAWMLRPLTRHATINRLGRTLTRPAAAFLLFNIYFSMLHYPRFYETMLHDLPVHVASHLTIMATGVLLWWPILGPLPEWPRLPYAGQLLYIVLVAVVMVPVGAIITLAPDVLYPTYYGASRLGLWSPLEDQQIAGATMWVGGGLYILGVLTVVFFRWAAQEERLAHGEATQT